MQIKSGTYTGNSTDNRTITGLGWQPHFVMIKAAASASLLWSAGSDQTKDSTAAAFSSGLIKSLDSDGFTLGTTGVNVTGTTYYWTAFRDNGTTDFKVLTYTGNGSSRSITGAGFQPDFVLVYGNNAQTPRFKTPDLASSEAIPLGGGTGATGLITSLDSDGFSLGTSSVVNQNTISFVAVCIKNVAGVFKTFGYTGDANDDRSITGVGFQPDFALTKRDNATTVSALRFKDQVGDSSFGVNATAAANRIQSFVSDGIQVGTANEVNASTSTYYAFASKDTSSSVDVTPTPLIIEAAIVSPALALDVVLTPVLIEATIVAPTAGTAIPVALDPVVIEVSVIPPTIDVVAPEPLPFIASLPGRTEVHFFDPAWNEVEPDEPVYLLNWETHRYQNRVGDWSASLPIDNGLIDGVPLHRYLRRGWHISFRQENNFPLNDEDLWLLYLGVIQQRDYESQDGGTYLRLSGGMRELHLTDRPARGQQFVSQPANLIGSFLVSGDSIIGPLGGLLSPSLPPLSTTFKDPSTRFEALIKNAGYARVAYRESWYFDRPEYTLIDNPPDSGITLRKVASFAEAMELSAEDGWGIIADPPSVRFDGQNIVNRIIAIGSDTPDGDLTLASASVGTPYPVLSVLNTDGSTSYYIEDAASIAMYGLVETNLVRTDVKNPSDDAGTRTAAANVLYATAAGQLLKHKSEIMVVEIPVANGADVWALPGDKIRLTYAGQVETLSGTVSWIDEDRFFMISERHDTSDPSGVRRVRFVLQAPEIEMTIPDLPGAIILPPQNTDPDPFDPGDPGGPGDPDFPQSSDCCPDPGTDTPDGGTPVPDVNTPPVIPPPIIPPPDPDPPEEGEAPYWISILPEQAGLSDADGVNFERRAYIAFQLASELSGTDIDITDLGDVSYLLGSGLPATDYMSLVRPTGPNPRITPTVALYGFLASADITTMTALEDDNVSNPSVHYPGSGGASANSSIANVDSRDALLARFGYSSAIIPAVDMVFNGVSGASIRRGIGPISMPSEIDATWTWGGPVSPNPRNELAYIMQVRLRITA